MKKPIAVIVDAYSTGARLADVFREYDIDCIHVQSSINITNDFLVSYHKQNFKQEFVVNDICSIDRIYSSCVGQNVVCVIAGTETGVEVAEKLAHFLGLEGNNPNTSILRRNKFAMHEELRKFGLSDIKQARCDTVNAATAWAAANNSWPLVVKPTSSAGADGVTFCHCIDDVRNATSAIIGQINKLGLMNDAAVLQERIVGQQFIVNAVSKGGKHFISEIWRDDKIIADGASLICDREVLLESNSSISERASEYVVSCLNVLGVTDGPSHSEIFQRENGQFLLIETAARMQGTIDDKAVIEATNHSHVTLTVLRYAKPDEFAKLLNTKYGRNNHLHCVTLCSSETGVVLKNLTKEKISTLQSFRSLIHTPCPGEHISRTIDLFSSPGIVYLAHRDEFILNEDYGAIRDMERRKELFVVQPAKQHR